jgi:hypothetical protein
VIVQVLLASAIWALLVVAVFAGERVSGIFLSPVAINCTQQERYVHADSH